MCNVSDKLEKVSFPDKYYNCLWLNQMCHVLLKQ